MLPSWHVLIEKELHTVVHGDNIMAAGVEEVLLWLEHELGRFWEIVREALFGPDGEDEKEATVLNRVVRLV